MGPWRQDAYCTERNFCPAYLCILQDRRAPSKELFFFLLRPPHEKEFSSFFACLVIDAALARAVSSTFFVSFSWNSSPKRKVEEEGNSSDPYLDQAGSTASRICVRRVWEISSEMLPSRQIVRWIMARTSPARTKSRGVTRIISERRLALLIIHYLRMRAIRHARKARG